MAARRERRRRVTPSNYYRTLHRIADGQVRKVEQAFLQSIGAGRVNRKQLRAALARNDGEAIAAALKVNSDVGPRLRRTMTPILAQTVTAAAVATAAVELPQMHMRFNLVNERAVRWAAEHAATLVREVTDGTRANIRSIVSQAQRGTTIEGQKRLIRDVLLADPRAISGLTTRQFLAVLNVGSKLLRRVEAGELDRDAALRRLDRYQTQQLNRRARTIARTETIGASTQGQQEAWNEALDQGYLTGAELREWIITPDDRLCKYCEAIPGLNPDGVGLMQPFIAPNGGRVMRPPAHPNCRCAMGLTTASLFTETRVAA